ncbi:MAG: hypothetical protein NVSMB64_07610 [Candidatus Velthaea sp.]
MIHSDHIATRAVDFLQSCTPLAATPERAQLCDLAVRRVIGSLFDGNTSRLENWYNTQRAESVDEMEDILHAACHAVAYGFERDDRGRLADALYALDLIECELTHGAAGRRCCHDHKLGITARFRKIA